MPVRSVAITDVGCVRKKNEDSFLCDDELGLYCVADGMGGHAGGEIASAEAIDQIHTMIRQALPQIRAVRANPDDTEARSFVRRRVEAAIQAATYMVFGIAEQDPDRKGMGTTMSVLLFLGPCVIVGQVGDSRVYLVRQGNPVQITEDHTLVNLQLKAGAITPEQAKQATYQNLITRAVGVKDYVEVDTFDVECRPQDRFVLCSDGVHGYIDTERELADMMRSENLDLCGRALIDNALKRGGKDNATVVMIEVVA